MIVYSDINLEPFISLKDLSNVDFFYREDYIFPKEIENRRILFIFSDYFRLYSKNNIKTILNLISKAKKKNNVILVGDLFFSTYNFSNEVRTINSGINKDDYNLELGYYSQFPFKKSGISKLNNLIETTLIKSKNPIIKAIFVDLDHTLIPGVWEEDKNVIKVSYQNPKNWKYKRLLQILVKSHSHGTQIILVSKNDKESIEEALSFIYPNWKNILTFLDYGWEQKAKRIKKNIKIMNIGAQDCIFIDDNEIEISNVKNAIPEINEIHFNDSSKLDKIEKLCFHSIDLEKSLDVERNKFYTKALGSDINMTIGIAKTKYSSKIKLNDESDFERIKELSVKTNQMNFNKSEIVTIDFKRFDYYSIQCNTEFANLGMIGYYVFNKKKMIIENFVMSCRALGFGLENEFLDSALSLTNKFKFRETLKNNVAQILIKKYVKNERIIVQSP